MYFLENKLHTDKIYKFVASKESSTAIEHGTKLNTFARDDFY